MTPTREASIRRHIARLKEYQHVDEFKRETIRELVEYWETKLAGE